MEAKISMFLEVFLVWMYNIVSVVGVWNKVWLLHAKHLMGPDSYIIVQCNNIFWFGAFGQAFNDFTFCTRIYCGDVLI